MFRGAIVCRCSIQVSAPLFRGHGRENYIFNIADQIKIRRLHQTEKWVLMLNSLNTFYEAFEA